MKAKYLLTIFLGFLVAVIGQSFCSQLQIGKAILNLPLIVLIFYCFLSKDDLNNLIIAFAMAFFLELNSSDYGLYFTSFLLLWLALKIVVKMISEKNLLSFAVISFGSIAFFQLLFFLSSLFLKSSARYFNWQSLLYNFLFAMVVYLIYDFAKKKIQN